MNLKTITNVSMAVLTVALMSGAPAALAANVNVNDANAITGSNSSNTNTRAITDDAILRVDNFAHALNALFLDLHNGGNDLNNNTTVAGFSSGNIIAAGTVVTNLNATPVLAAGVSLPNIVTGSFSNGTTGANSENSNVLTVDTNRVTTIDNHASLHNSIGVDVSTGHNDINNNTTVGPVSLGGAAVSLSLVNGANSGAAALMPVSAAPSVVNVSGGNSTTGASSENSNTTTVSNNAVTSIDNTAHIDNHAHIDVGTGGNDINSNTTVGPVSTGDVLVNLSFVNSAN